MKLRQTLLTLLVALGLVSMPFSASAESATPTPTTTSTSYASESADSPKPAAPITPGAGMGWGSDPVSSEQASQMECASVMFVGVRGSGETPPYGATITSIRDAVAQKWKG